MEDLINIHFCGKLFFSSSIEKENYNIYYSSLIDDEYYNLVYLKNNNMSLINEFNNIEIEMQKINRIPTLYITSNIMNSCLEKDLEKLNFKLLYTDVWMSLNNLKDFPKYKSNVNFIIEKADENSKVKFTTAVINGFSTGDPEDPYPSLPEGYRISIERSFDKNESEYKIRHYYGIKDTEIISTATVMYKNDKAVMYNVTTNKNYQRKGVFKQMMSYIVNDLISLNINELCVQTEFGFYTQQVYKNIGFKEILLGKAFGRL